MKKLIFIFNFFYLCATSSCCQVEDGDVFQPVIPYSLPALENNNLRVVSYNLLFEKTVPSELDRRWVNRKEKVKQLFTNYSFDIIGTQEALTSQVNDILSWKDWGRIGGDLPHGDIDCSFNEENEAVFYKKSRFEVLEEGNFWFSESPDKPGTYSWGATYPRMCTWGKFKEKTTGRIFYIYNSHFNVDAPQSRIESAKMILNKVKAVAGEYPVICTGDLNSVPEEESVLTLLGDGTLKDSKLVATTIEGAGGTYHGFSSEATTRLDYVMVTDKVGVNVYRAIDNELRTARFGSDHLPVVVDVILK